MNASRADFTVELYTRSGAPLLPTQHLQLTPRMFRSTDIGGPDIAEIEVHGSEENLAAIDDWLACRVVIRNAAGNVVWFGYVHEVSRSSAALEIGYSLDAMANRIAADYTFEDAAGETQSGRTAWFGDPASQNKYGVKEELLSFADSTEEQATAAAATMLAARAFPVPTLEISDQTTGGGMLRCRGWWHQLDWRFYANDTGRLLKMAEADIEHALGYVRVSNQIGFKDKKIHDLAARLNELPTQQQIRVSGAAQSVNNGIFLLDGDPPDTSATTYTATTISFDPLDDIIDSAQQLGIFSVGEMINVAGASRPENNATRFIKTVAEPPGRIEATPGTIVAEPAGALVTLTQGHSTSVKNRPPFAREPAGAYITLAPVGVRLAQSFRVSSAWTIRQAAIQARAVGAPAALRLSIYSDVAGAPGAQLATTTVAAASVPRKMGWIQGDFAPGAALQANTTYWLVVEIDGGVTSDINYYRIGLDSTCADADGSLLVYTGSAWAPRTPNADMPFQLWSVQDTATQIKNMLVASGVFTSVRLESASNVETRQYRDGNQRIRTEIERLLQVGDNDSTQLIVSLACDATGAPAAAIQSKPTATDDILLLPSGEIIDALTQRWEAGKLPVGRWVSVTGTRTSRAIAERLYVSAAEYDVAAQRLRITPQFQSSPWGGDDSPPPQKLAQAVKPYLGGGGVRSATMDAPSSADYLLADGSRQLVGNLSVAPGVTIDGVDISEHAANPAAHHPPATAGDGISVVNQQIAVDSTVVRTSRQIIAGAGLIGGGSLAGNVTLALGTPGGLSATTTNAATTTSHTHAIATGAAVSLSVATVNAAGTSANLARADHTHAITTSSNPGAAASILASNPDGYLQLVRLGLGKAPTVPLDVSGAAAISGALSAGSAYISGSATIVGDLSVGTVLQVNTAGTRVGINRAPDQQFDLDVAGAIRGQYLVGRHAIQLSSAVGVWHYDGPAPYNLDFSGTDASHVGVSAQPAGAVIYRPGRFGKAAQIAPASTNLILNPSFETGASHWANYSTGSATGTRTRVDSVALYGKYSYRLEKTGGEVEDRWGIYHNINVTAGQTYTFSAWIKVEKIAGGDRRVRLFAGTNVPDTSAFLYREGDWRRVQLTATATATGTARLYIWIDSAATATIYVDAVQVEQSNYATPYLDGSLGIGHSWSGTPHASTSTRSGAALLYPPGLLNTNEGTLMLYAYYEDVITGGLGLWGTGAGTSGIGALISTGHNIVFWQAGTNLTTTQNVSSKTWYHYAFTWSKSQNFRKIFIDGVEVASRQFDDGAVVGPALLFGSTAAGASRTINGFIDEVVLLDYAADPKLIRAIYESDAPVFVESSVFHWRSPSRVPIWVDEFGLWARGVGGNEILGLYGGDPRAPEANVTKSWGGITMEENDIVIGRAAQAAMHWDDSDGTLLIGKPSAANLLLSGGALRIRSGSTDKIALNSDGSANITGVLTISSAGGFYAGSGTFTNPSTGLKIWNDGNSGRIAGFANGVLQWGASTTGKLTAGADNVVLDADGITQLSNTNESNNSEPPLTPLLPVIQQRISLRDKPSATNWGYIDIYAGPQNYFYPGMEWLRIYVSSQHFIEPLYTGSAPVNWHAWDGVIEIPNNVIPSQAGTVIRRRLLLKAPQITLDGKLEYAKLAVLLQNPPATQRGEEARLYVKNNKLIVQYNDEGTVRYKYLELSGTSVTWTHTTTPP